MTKQIRIETVNNGYILYADESPQERCIVSARRYAFESFDGLVNWLDANLEKPKADVGLPYKKP